MAAPALGRYAELHLAHSASDDRRPTGMKILQDNEVIGKLGDKTFLVTGGTAGLGRETVRQLAKTGARVFFTARNPEKAEKVVREIKEEGKADADLKGARIEWVNMDNTSLESVKACSEDFLKRSDRLDALVCNAGISTTPFFRTQDGFEGQFGVNHLAHFYLFQLVKPLLIRSATPSSQSRVVAVSSSGHATSKLQIGNYNLEKHPEDGYWKFVDMGDGKYNPMIGYGQSKTANISFANELDRRYQSQGIRGLSLHPGNILTNMWDTVDPRMMERLSEFADSLKHTFKSVEQGAATQLLATIGRDFEGKGGIYLEDCGVAQPNPEEAPVGGYRPWAYDAESEKRLWIDSLDMVGLKDDQ